MKRYIKLVLIGLIEILVELWNGRDNNNSG